MAKCTKPLNIGLLGGGVAPMRPKARPKGAPSSWGTACEMGITRKVRGFPETHLLKEEKRPPGVCRCRSRIAGVKRRKKRR